MLEYELLRELFLLLKVKNTSLKHWLNNIGWYITKAMYDVVFSKVVSVILKTNYVVVSVDKVTIIDV
jgi:hypothetical protein